MAPLAVAAHELGHGDLLQVGAGADALALEFLRALRADAPDFPHRQLAHECLDTVGRDRKLAVRQM